MPADSAVVRGTDDGHDQGVQVISRAAHVLRSLAEQRDGMTVAAISHDLALPRSTTHRILRALSVEGLTRRTATGHYTLGYGLRSLATAARSELQSRAASHMLRLSSSLGETVEFAVLCGADALLLDRLVSGRTLRAASEIGERLPGHSTAAGKALLSTLPRDQLLQVLPDPLTALTASTITDRTALLAELDDVRRTGSAFSVEEHAAGVCSVAVAISDRAGETAALSVVVPAARFDGKIEIAAALVDERRRLQHDLGAPLADQPA
jgi:DNA-binding IclR family transcriptional regulator